jgi:hypothetical protein
MMRMCGHGHRLKDRFQTLSAFSVHRREELPACHLVDGIVAACTTSTAQRRRRIEGSTPLATEAHVNEPTALLADVFVDREVPAEAERELVAALAGAGVSAHAKVVAARRGPEQLHWLVLVALPLQAFLTGVGEAAAADAWAGIKSVLRRLAGRPTPERARPLVLQDSGTGLQIVLPPDLSEEGYRRLTQLDLTTFSRGPVRYDEATGRWISDLDEARRK